MDRGKNLVIMSFTRRDAKARRGLAHTALGGGGMGLFGSGTLYAWPRSLREVGPITLRMIDRQGNEASTTDARLIHDRDYLRE